MTKRKRPPALKSGGRSRRRQRRQQGSKRPSSRTVRRRRKPVKSKSTTHTKAPKRRVSPSPSKRQKTAPKRGKRGVAPHKRVRRGSSKKRSTAARDTRKATSKKRSKSAGRASGKQQRQKKSQQKQQGHRVTRGKHRKGSKSKSRASKKTARKQAVRKTPKLGRGWKAATPPQRKRKTYPKPVKFERKFKLKQGKLERQKQPLMLTIGLRSESKTNSPAFSNNRALHTYYHEAKNFGLAQTHILDIENKITKNKKADKPHQMVVRLRAQDGADRDEMNAVLQKNKEALQVAGYGATYRSHKNADGTIDGEIRVELGKRQGFREAVLALGDVADIPKVM